MKYYSIREDILKSALFTMTPSTFAVFTCICSQYQFLGKPVALSYNDFQDKTNLSRGSVAAAIKYLVNKNFISRNQNWDKVFSYSITPSNITNLLDEREL